MPIVWLLNAVQDAMDIRTYIAEQDPEAASIVATRVDQAITNLSAMPNMGRKGRIFGTRELVISDTSYIAIYRVQDSRIEILRILHGRQSFPESNEM
jgi:toxin ParE1/3/4